MPAPAAGGPAAGGGPLAGVRVVDLTINVLGPMATQLLGDMGADVIKVETPSGDQMRTLGPTRNPGMAAHFMGFNRNKRSVVLDLKRPAALGALMRLIETADVFVHNMRAGAAERLGIGYAAVSARNPRIVYAYATGYDRNGPYRDRPAYDDVIQGESGLAAMIGRANGEPRYVPMAIADKLCGVYLAMGISMALVGRGATGRGQEVHVPMFETMVSFNLVDHMWEATFDAPEKGVGYPRMFTPHRRPYPTLDGHISLMAVSADQWRRLFAAMDRPELADDPRFATMESRTEHIDALYGIIAQEMAKRPTAEWRRRLDEADIPNAAMKEPADLLRDPYLEETGFLRHMQHPSEGPTLNLGLPLAFADSPAALRRPPPRLGEHTEEVLRELGFTDADLPDLRP